MRINIYLTENEKMQLKEMQNKYKVSISTIADNVLFYLTKYLLFDKRQDIIYVMNETNMYEGQKDVKKTSIKPKGQCTETPINEFHEHKNRAYTNALKIYLNKDVKKYLTDENRKAFYNDLNEKLMKTYEPNYMYNQFIRNMSRYEKKNKGR